MAAPGSQQAPGILIQACPKCYQVKGSMGKLNSLQSSFTSGTWTQEACLGVFYMVFTVASLTPCPGRVWNTQESCTDPVHPGALSWMSPSYPLCTGAEGTRTSPPLKAYNPL